MNNEKYKEVIRVFTPAERRENLEMADIILDLCEYRDKRMKAKTKIAELSKNEIAREIDRLYQKATRLSEFAENPEKSQAQRAMAGREADNLIPRIEKLERIQKELRR